jgi:signal transduction histidine kinase
VGQLMHAMKYGLETALQQLESDEETADVRATLERLTPILQEAAAENRRIVMDLRPSMLDDLGLLATVNWFCREFSGIYKSIAIDKNIVAGEDDIPVALRVVLYRIIQEAFNNVAKHSQASRVRLTIAKEANDLVVEIEDNGIGLQQENRRSDRQIGRGFGLSSMRERARASGGLFHLTAASGVGTRVRVVWTKQSGPNIETGSDWQI